MEAQRFVFRIKDIVFGSRKSEFTYKGRNGVGVCEGLAISHLNSTIALMPINSKGEISSSCHIKIPSDPQLLRDIARDLLRIADSGATVGDRDNG